MNDAHYIGFMDECARLGIEKRAASLLYKSAAPTNARLFADVLKGVGSLFRLGTRGVNYGWKAPFRAYNSLSKVKWLTDGIDAAKQLPMAGMRSWGQFASKHPILGSLAVAAPVAFLAGKRRSDNDDMLSVDTFTPAQRRMFDRSYAAEGYAGLDGASSLSGLGFL